MTEAKDISPRMVTMWKLTERKKERLTTAGASRDTRGSFLLSKEEENG